MNKSCKLCKNSDPGLFVFDSSRGDTICTSCGCVQTGWNNSANNTTYSDPIDIRIPSNKEKKFLRLNEQMINKVCPDEYKEYKRNDKIREFCFKLDLSESIATRSIILMDKYKYKICNVRPIINLIASCIIITCQMSKRYINIGDTEKFLDLKNVNPVLKTVCKLIGINQRSIILNSVSFLISIIGLPFKFEKKLRELYKITCRKNPSMGAETRMALCCYKLYVDNEDKAKNKKVDLEYIAQITNTSENSLKSYIAGKTKNSLFQMKRKRNDNTNTSSKKLKS